MHALQSFFQWIPIGLTGFLFVLTVVVLCHELGHFSVARAFGVKIETFSVGFGPAIASWVDRKGTQWKISWVPFGGYVKFFGDMGPASTPDNEKLENATAEERSSAFQCKPLYQRALIAVAGPAANFVLAVVVFSAMFMFFGEGTLSTAIGKVTPGDPAAIAGIQAGDRILAINGKPVHTWSDLQTVTRGSNGQPLTMSLNRHGKTLSLRVQPKKLEAKDIYGEPVKFTGVGLEPSANDSDLIMTHLGPVDAVAAGANQVEFVVTTTLTYLWRIVSGHADSSQLSGPVGIANVSQQVASTGMLNLIRLIAFISVSIGMVNLFPIPILDGGHLLYYGCEAVLGRPLGARVQDLGFRLGLAVMLGLMLFATWNDLVRLNLF